MKIKYKGHPCCHFSFYWGTINVFNRADYRLYKKDEISHEISFCDLRHVQLFMDTHFKNINISTLMGVILGLHTGHNYEEYIYGAYHYDNKYTFHIRKSDFGAYMFVTNFEHFPFYNPKIYFNILDIFKNLT